MNNVQLEQLSNFDMAQDLGPQVKDLAGCRECQRAPREIPRVTMIQAGSRVYQKHVCAFMRILAKLGEL